MHSSAIASARNMLISELSGAMSAALKKLLETKHLYQSIAVDPAPLVARAMNSLSASAQTALASGGGFQLDGLPFSIMTEELTAVSRDGTVEHYLTILVQNTKLFCTACDNREVFAPQGCQDLEHMARRFLSMSSSGVTRKPPAVPTQVYAISFSCQLCNGPLHGVLVRRSGFKLTLEGRSPMEHVAVPSFIPKAESHLYRDALIAAHGGKVLAALFYLRAFIEQFARRQAQVPGRATGDEIMSAYATLLPSPVRDTMPSLKEWYERLSEPLHSANADEGVWLEALAAIDLHFDIRRVHRIPDRTATQA